MGNDFWMRIGLIFIALLMPYWVLSFILWDFVSLGSLPDYGRFVFLVAVGLSVWGATAIKLPRRG